MFFCLAGMSVQPRDAGGQGGASIIGTGFGRRATFGCRMDGKDGTTDVGIRV